jgi:hypothetical protein
MNIRIAAFMVASLLIASLPAACQAAASSGTRIETGQELEARLTAVQKQQFEAAKSAHMARRFTEALSGFKALLQDLPGDVLLLKYASNAALQAGDPAYALDALKPIRMANVEDWQAVSMLAWAAAESGDAQTRDFAMTNMVMLKQAGLTPPNLTQYVVERVKVGESVMTIQSYLVPSGPYKIFYIGRVADAKGAVLLRITLESSDADQPVFAREHPKEAAAGVRSFTLDGYQETGLNQAGQRTQTHYTYEFLMGSPAYDTVRAEFLKAAEGKTAPLSRRTGIVVAQ